MPASRPALFAFSFAVACTALVACRVATQQNDLHLGGESLSSAQITAPPEDAGTVEVVDASVDEVPDASDASSDADADANPGVAPPCTQQTMYSSATSTTCAADSLIITGGTIGTGGYYLTRWADEQKGCKSTSTKQGTMSIENVGGKLFMRWTTWFEGKTQWGTYELAPNTSTSFKRGEVCNWTSQMPVATIVSYSASSTDILFFHDNGQERWTRIPKAFPTGPQIDPGVFSSGFN